jgi:hypothetical protein
MSLPHGAALMGCDDPDAHLPLKERVRQYVYDTDHVSFAELGNRFGDHFKGGDREISKGENIIVWSGMSQEGAQAIVELLEEGIVALAPASTLIYLCDGAMPSLPIVKRLTHEPQ